MGELRNLGTCFAMFLLLLGMTGVAFAAPIPLPSHRTCQSNRCVTVIGPGANTCTSDANCVPVISGTHLACVGTQCRTVAGAGRNTCTSNNDCLPSIAPPPPQPQLPPIPPAQQAGLSGLSGGMLGTCQTAKGMLGIAVMLLVILSALTYAIGQIAGAETRSRAVVWASAMMTGAIIGVIIYILVPYIVVTVDPTMSAAMAQC